VIGRGELAVEDDDNDNDAAITRLNGAQNKKAEAFASAFSGSYPPPGILPNSNLLQWAFGTSAARQSSGAVAHDGICD